MPGPAPNPNARRTNHQGEWRSLPATGRAGDPPAWPLGGRLTKSLVALWDQLWSKPQAVVWEEQDSARVVARYARLVLEAEKPGASSALLGEVRQLEDRLGLTALAMRRNYWIVGGSTSEELPADVANLDDFRDRVG